MTLVDDRVLEYIRENESGSPTAMKRDAPIHYSREYVHKRCKKLSEKGLLKDLGNGVYVITDDGKAYLDGDLDTQNWIRLDDSGNHTPNVSEADEEV
jgi:Mn-dependent DtxR family transcriptional regulator